MRVFEESRGGSIREQMIEFAILIVDINMFEMDRLLNFEDSLQGKRY